MLSTVPTQPPLIFQIYLNPVPVPLLKREKRTISLQFIYCIKLKQEVQINKTRGTNSCNLLAFQKSDKWKKLFIKQRYFIRINFFL